MKRRRHGNKQSRPMKAIRLWTFDEAAKAVPYLRSVVGSLREHWLDALSRQRSSELLAGAHGRATRERIIAADRLGADREHSETKFNEALDELMRIDVYLLDPVRGLALIPFRHEDDLAWYVYDQFDQAGLSGWRYHSDPIEQCRPLTGPAPAAGSSLPNEAVG